LWANFYNAIFLLIYILVARTYINMIPYAALAAMLIHTGWKLCRPAVWRHVAHLGREQLFLFAATVLVTLSTDLLWGIVFGIVAKLVMVTIFSGRGLTGIPDLFRNPVTHRETVDGAFELYFGRPLVCFNSMHLNGELAGIPGDAGTLRLHVTHNVTLIDHTSCDTLHHFAEEYERSGRGAVEFVGLDRLDARSHHRSAMRRVPKGGDATLAGDHHPGNGDGLVPNSTPPGDPGDDDSDPVADGVID
jgi:MFS superfamily sulfate permease-like transporter